MRVRALILILTFSEFGLLNNSLFLFENITDHMRLLTVTFSTSHGFIFFWLSLILNSVHLILGKFKFLLSRSITNVLFVTSFASIRFMRCIDGVVNFWLEWRSIVRANYSTILPLILDFLNELLRLLLDQSSFAASVRSSSFLSSFSWLNA